MTAKSRARKASKRTTSPSHFSIEQLEESGVTRYKRVTCTCSEDKNHFAKENN